MENKYYSMSPFTVFLKSKKMLKCAETISKCIHKRQQRLLGGVKMKAGESAEEPLLDFIPFNLTLFFSQYFKKFKSSLKTFCIKKSDQYVVTIKVINFFKCENGIIIRL